MVFKIVATRTIHDSVERRQRLALAYAFFEKETASEGIRQDSSEAADTTQRQATQLVKDSSPYWKKQNGGAR